MFLDIEHDLKFDYDEFISESWVELRMEPTSGSRQTVHSFFLAVGPRTKVFRYEDWGGNAVRHFSVAEFHKQIEVRSRTIVETKPMGMDLDQVGEPVAEFRQLGPVQEFLSFGGPITRSEELRHLFERIGITPAMSVGERVDRIGRFVHETFQYRSNVTTYRSTIDEALSHFSGVCQDLAQIMIGLLRLARIPARYINGYLHVDREGGTSESHAWVEFFSTEHGWVGYDPTGGLMPGERHVVVAVGRHYDDVPPNKGVFRGVANEKLLAVVRTAEIQAPARSSFREEIREIELPVYREIPGKRSVSAPQDQADQENQQQQ